MTQPTQPAPTPLSNPSVGGTPDNSGFGAAPGATAAQPPLQTTRGGGAVDFFQAPRVATQPPFVGRKVSDGLSVRVVCPDGQTSQQGEFHILDGFAGFNLTRPKLDPAGDIPIILQIEQCEYETVQLDPGGAFAAGAHVFFTAADKLLHDGAGDRFVGIVTVAKDASGAIWMILAAQGATAPTA